MPTVVVGMSGILEEDLDRYQGIRTVAREAGWQLVPLRERFEARLTALIEDEAVDGVIAPFISESWVQNLPEPRPVMVHVGPAAAVASVSSVSVDAEEVGRAAAVHLMEQGVREFAYIGIPGSQICLGYEAGFREAVGAEVQTSRLQAPGYLRDLLKSWTSGVGVLCQSSFQARQLIQEARALGRAIPDDLLICSVGEQELDQLAAGMGITTIPLPHELIGREAAACLREQLMYGGAAKRIVLSPEPILVRASSRETGVGEPAVERAVEMIRRNLADPDLSMEMVAARCGLSRRSLEQKFKSAMNTTPYAYVLQLRLDVAKTLLRETGLQVRQVGERVGFPDPQRFSAFFKKQTGASPGRWRA